MKKILNFLKKMFESKKRKKEQEDQELLNKIIKKIKEDL